jgi:molybdopterin synthase catalytic subunit
MSLVPPLGDNWCALTDKELPVGEIYAWSVRADCGAVVLFSGTVRDHAEGRPGVSVLEYEAYESHVVPRLEAIVTEIRGHWTGIGRVALLHRVGPLSVGESSVLVSVSSGHRPEAFEAARYGIDALKGTVPIWKRETWEGGTDWGLAATAVTDASSLLPQRNTTNNNTNNTNTINTTNTEVVGAAKVGRVLEP